MVMHGVALVDPQRASGKKRVCVIGAGPSGLAVLRAFWSAQLKGEEIPEIVCYEKQSDVGGLWNYDWRTGLDEFGEPVHGAMYRYLWSNGPKECLEFADYTFDEHFKKPIASFPPRAVLVDYIKGRINKTNVREWCKLQHVVRDVHYDTAKGKFHVRACKLSTQTDETSMFDHVVVCTGHFSVPNVPYFKGFETFEGRILHSGAFRDAEEFRDKRVLIIGTSSSAEDIGSQCYKYGAASVTFSWRTAPMPFDWPESFRTVPLLESIDYCSKTCRFVDGSMAEVDAIVLCTGYKHHFPFLEDALRLRTNNRLWVSALRQGIFWHANSNLMYIGMQDQYYTYNMFDAQAWVARDYMMGKLTLSIPELDVTDAAWAAREEKLNGASDDIKFQGDYVQSLIELTDYPMFDIPGVNKAFIEWKHNKMENIMTFRDKSHTSLMTGTRAPVHHTPWIKAMDDSLESYLHISVPSTSDRE